MRRRPRARLRDPAPYRLQPLLSPRDPNFHFPRDGLGLEMDSLRCLCTENPGDWKGVAEGRGPKLKDTSRSRSPAGPSHPGMRPRAAECGSDAEECPAAPRGPVCREPPVCSLGPQGLLKPTSHLWDTTTRLVLPLFLSSPQSQEA